MLAAKELTRVTLPTPYGLFEAHAFESEEGTVHLALVKGGVAGRDRVLTRLHSECLTGDALGSLRCDCGVQLRLALRMIAAAGEGVLVYVTGHEGRGIGLMNKLRAYVEQDNGADTVDANLHLGLPVDARRYDDVTTVLTALGVRSVTLLTNNPSKVEAIERLGVKVDGARPLSIAPHVRSLGYIRTKQARLGHVEAGAEALDELDATPPEVMELMGPVRAHEDRPYVVLKYAQTLDGRIATAVGDSKWISCDAERTVSHALRAACDAVMVGIDTVVRDDPQLTVRMVAGSSPLRVVLDSTLRMPRDAKVLGDHAGTVVFTTNRAHMSARQWLEDQHVAVHVVQPGPHGVDIVDALRVLRQRGVESLLVEGGAKVITSLLAAGLVDRLVVAVAPTIIGAGTEAVGDLGVRKVVEGIRLHSRFVCSVDDDVMVAFDVGASPGEPGEVEGSAYSRAVSS
jgi:GTP cyclohydrolase II